METSTRRMRLIKKIFRNLQRTQEGRDVGTTSFQSEGDTAVAICRLHWETSQKKAEMQLKKQRLKENL